MGIEIERKFLVSGDAWRAQATAAAACTDIRQGYLSLGPPVSVRVRIRAGQATLTIKRAMLDIAREEYEYPLPLADAEEFLERFCVGSIIEKTRHCVDMGGLCWEVDVFGGDNAGLIVAEIELEDADQSFERPPWLGAEVSGDARYLNSSLCVNPYSRW